MKVRCVALMTSCWLRSPVGAGVLKLVDVTSAPTTVTFRANRKEPVVVGGKVFGRVGYVVPVTSGGRDGPSTWPGPLSR